MILSCSLMDIHVKGKFKKMLLGGTFAVFDPLQDETVF